MPPLTKATLAARWSTLMAKSLASTQPYCLRSGGSNGIGLAIPVELAKPIVNQLISNGVVQRGFVGIGGQDVDDELAEALGLPRAGGVIINEVVSDSGAAAAGLQIQDVITAINGQPIEDWAAFPTNRSPPCNQAPSCT